MIVSGESGPAWRLCVAHLLRSFVGSSAMRASGVLDTDGTTFGPRATCRNRYAHGLERVATRAGTRGLTRGDADKCQELVPVGLLEPGDERLPGRSGQVRRVAFQRSERRPLPEADGHRVARPDDLHPDVVAAWIVAGLAQHAQRAVDQAEHRGRGVHVVVPGEDLEAPHRAGRVDLLHLLAGQPAQRVEVMDRRVSEQAAADRDVVVRWRLMVVGDEADEIEGAE